MNYFEVFNLDVDFIIDKNLLKSTYSILIKENHPDNFVVDKKQELQALENTSLINQAYKTLNDDLLRATYILELNNINAFDEKDTKMDSDFLLKQINLQEQLNDIKEELELYDFIEAINDDIKLSITEISKNFNNKNLENVRNLVRELKFYYQLKKLTNQKLDNFI